MASTLSRVQSFSTTEGSRQPAPSRQPLQLRTGRQVVEQGAHETGKILGRERHGIKQCAHPLGQHDVEELLLAAVVDIDQALVGLGGLRDPVYPRSGEPILGELREGRIEQSSLGGSGIRRHARSLGIPRQKVTIWIWTNWPAHAVHLARRRRSARHIHEVRTGRAAPPGECHRAGVEQPKGGDRVDKYAHGLDANPPALNYLVIDQRRTSWHSVCN